MSASGNPSAEHVLPLDETGLGKLTRMPLTTASVIAAVTCALLWAGQGIAVKVATLSLPAFRIVCLRLLLSASLLAVWAGLRKRPLQLSVAGHRAVQMNAAFLLTQLTLYTAGTSQTTSVHSVVLINTFPFFAMLGGFVFLPELKVGGVQVLALLLAFGGAALVLTSRANEQIVGDSVSLWGDGFILLAAAVMGSKLVFLKSVLASHPPIPVVFWTAVYGSLVSGLVSLLFEPLGQWPTDLRSIAAVLYQGWAVSGVAFVLWNLLLARHAPNDLTPFRLLTPLLGAVLGWWILAEAVGPATWAGAILIVLGTLLVTWNSRRNSG